MIPYQISKDYKRLKELLDKGEKIIVVIDDFIAGFAFAREDNGRIDYILPEYSYYFYYDYRTTFENHCQKIDIGFIEPNL